MSASFITMSEFELTQLALGHTSTLLGRWATQRDESDRQNDRKVDEGRIM